MKLLVFTFHDFVNVLLGSERMILVLYNQPFQDVYPTLTMSFDPDVLNYTNKF